MLIEDLIKEVENHTGKPFDLTNRKQLFHLNSKIERLHENELRILGLIRQSMRSTNNEDSLYNSGLEFTRKRYKE